MDIILVGLGNVGQGFLSILTEKSESLRNAHDFEARIVGAITRSRGTLYCANGLDPQKLLEAVAQGNLSNYPDDENVQKNLDIESLIRTKPADVMIEASPTNLETGQPALSYCYAALETGKHVVMANKGPVALDFNGLMQRAHESNKQVLYEGTVMAGTPSIRLAKEALAGAGITRARGILNGSTNYILSQMDTGLSYDEAIQEANDLGYLEADPSADLEGWDAASKVLILSAVLFGKTLALQDLDVTGITSINSEAIAEAHANGERWKLIAEITAHGGSVKPVRLSINDPLAGVSGSTNAITFSTDLMGDVTLVGSGAGRIETGFAILSDLLAIQRSNKYVNFSHP